MAEFRSDARHARIVNHYRTLIDQGRLKPGERLPTLPVLAVEWEMSRPTVSKALARLQDEGYIESVTGRKGGVFVKLGGTARLWQKLADDLNALTHTGQVPQLKKKRDGPCITGTDGGVRWNGESWERIDD